MLCTCSGCCIAPYRVSLICASSVASIVLAAVGGVSASGQRFEICHLQSPVPTPAPPCCNLSPGSVMLAASLGH